VFFRNNSLITAVAGSKNKVTPRADLHTHRGISSGSKYDFGSSKTGLAERDRLLENQTLPDNQFLPHVVAKTKVLERDPGEERAYFNYNAAPKIFKQLADYCEFGEGPRNYSFKNRIINFLEDRREFGDLESAIFFLHNLETMSNLTNKDGSRVIGVERVFENAEEAVEKGDKVHGFYFEAIAALSMMDAGFSIKEVSVRKIERNGTVEELIDNHGSYREIDFIAEKDFGEGVVRIFCDAKSSVVSMILSNRSTKQMDAFMEIADKYDAVPAIILKTRDAKVSSDGSIDYFQPKAISRKHQRQISRFLADYPGLLIWNESGNNIVSHDQPNKEDMPLVA